ncbi:plasmid stabilization protein [Phyllobacterium sp. P30BS-XVII]|uniref:FitA-like ribbon-helix-helix domain-containing protein n=1 Tax=Phyllobacterium sp. P30BS-XVII TaxID=2587046 RepID=UPI000DD93AA2|nr:plasmid stabilization protein [Phyllobacterium sp. P30BS-XVII]MBA8899464.1 plasmid stability protein [Phyllobacterium sp. P30BS-XVII]
MASMTIRNLDDQLKTRLRIQAAQHGKSMEDEARDILRAALSREPAAPANLAEAIQERFKALGGVDLPIAPREAARKPVDFSE